MLPLRPRSLALLTGLVLVCSLLLGLLGGTVLDRRQARSAEGRLRAEATLAADLLRRQAPDLAEGARPIAEILSRTLNLGVAVYGPKGELLHARGPGAEEAPTAGPLVREALHSGEATDRPEASGAPALRLVRRLEEGPRILGAVGLFQPPGAAAPGGGLSGALALALGSLPFVALLAVLGVLLGMRTAEPAVRLRIQAERLVEELLGSDLEDLRRQGLHGLARDLGRARRVTAELLAELKAGRALTASVLESMREGVLALGPDGRVIFHNDAVLNLLGLGAQPLEGRPLLEVSRNAALGEAYRAVLQGKGPQERKFRIQGTTERHLEVRVVTLRDAAGAELGALGVLFDVTRLELLETVRQTFIANVSHELRTPLASIMAYTETLLEDALDDPDNARGFLEVVLRHARRMEILVNDLTDLSLIETGAVELEPGAVDVGALVEDVLDQLQSRAATRDVGLQADVPADLTVLGDRMRLEQILLNVVDNAVKFGPEGGQVRVAAWRDPEGVHITIEDQGEGLPEVELEKIFHRFYRVDKARSRELGGTGLGLSIVKHLMRLHGGSVQAENLPQGGLRIALRFPAEEDSPLRSGGRSQGQASGAGRGTSAAPNAELPQDPTTVTR